MRINSIEEFKAMEAETVGLTHEQWVNKVLDKKYPYYAAFAFEDIKENVISGMNAKGVKKGEAIYGNCPNRTIKKYENLSGSHIIYLGV